MTALIPQASPGSAITERRPEYDAAITRVLDSGRYILGDEVELFETEFASYVGTDHAIGVASGTDAVELALRAVGVAAGDAVFTVSLTAIATIAAIVRLGATPILVEIDGETCTMDPQRLADAIRGHRSGPRPAAVVPVHLYGAMADMPAITQVAASAGLRVVEDCAQAHGAACAGSSAGAWGDAAAFSFYPTKNLSAIGDGGAVTTNAPDVAVSVKKMREYGWRTRQVSEQHGVNSRLDEIQAAVLRVGLRYLDTDNARRIEIAARYDAGLGDSLVKTPHRRDDAAHVFHQYVVRAEHRENLRAWCSDGGVGTAVHYPVPAHRQPGYRDMIRVASDLKATEQVAAEVVSLPIFPQLTPDQVSRVIEVVREWRPT